jgi:hypothetical protein
MASNVKYAVTLKNDKLASISTDIGASGLLRGYSGTQPTNPDTALSGNTMLFNLALSATAAPAPSGGVATFNSITTETSADNTGTLTFCSLLTSGATRKVDMSAGTSGTDFIVNSTAIAAGAQVSCSSLTITSGN